MSLSMKCPHTFVLCFIITYVSSWSFLLFSWSVAFSFSCSTLRRSCSSIIFWFWLNTKYVFYQLKISDSTFSNKMEDRSTVLEESLTTSFHCTVLLYLHSPEIFPALNNEITHSWSSVMSFSFASTSSLRLLICFWCVSRWLWICCSTACY